ncbi:MAG: twin-arginine translocase TatA/TatE family subunit [Thaumarchaeota archaeon]|nr:twin-arginine translocase TatA/TatE family subunit [Nitrososphaerota archaeon]
MALDPLELIIIGVIVVVILLWGPKKIPEIARSIGLAKKEFDNAKKEATNIGTSMVTGAAAQSSSSPVMTSDEQLIETAHRLGIVTEGKTSQQISEEIVARAKTPYGR